LVPLLERPKAMDLAHILGEGSDWRHLVGSWAELILKPGTGGELE
jgi:hypothetical protein